ncbi:hypothetical protein [Flavobacterium sp.]|uniref:hypothetical protein n=1 Tax=Flavobacterium sp. TaxID=239 RepID=UPI0040485161
MSDFKQIINYLKFFRRSEDAALNNKYKEAIIVDENYKHKEIPHEDDFIFVEKKAVESQNGYVYLGHEIDDTIYLQQQSNGIIEYYIKKDFQINNETIVKHKRIPFYFTDVWEEKEGETFTAIATPGNYYYNQAIDKVIEISLDSVFVFPDYFVYHPNDLQDITNGDYSFNYKDEEGYTSDYSDLALRALLSTSYNLVSSETKRNVGFHKNDKAGFVFLLPKMSQRGGKYYLEYTYYQKGISYNSFITETAIRLEFNYFGAFLEFLNQTVFYGLDGLDAFNSNAKKLFLEDYTIFVENLLHFSSGTKILETLYFVPIFFFKKIDPNFLWYVLEKTLEYSVTNIGLNKEDIILRILEGIYESSKSDTIFLQEVVNKRTKSKKSLLHELIHSIDGDNFKKMLQFLWNIWKNSDFSTIDPEKNKFIDITNKNPVLIDYRSTKKLGFHTDNTAIEWKLNSNSIALKVVSGTGIYKEITVRTADGNDIRFVEEKITHDYDYHPLSPLAIIAADNPTFILKDEEQQEDSKFTNLPAFVLYANKESAFWENIMTGGEYAIDVLTTLSGVGNILKVGRLAKILKAGHSLIGKSKAVSNVITGVKAFAGVVEISSGVGNALLKLLDVNDTELGREIAEYLFYLEMISLSGEITVALHVGLKKNAKKLVGNAKNKAKLEKKLDDLVDQKQISKSEADEVIEHLYKLNDNGTAYNSSKYATKVSKLTDNASQKIKDFEIIHSNSSLENALIYNPETKLADFWTSDLPDKINFPQKLIMKMRKAVVTHNHPGGSGLSIPDIEMFLQGNLHEIRAVTPDGSVFSVKNKSLSGKEMQSFAKDIQKINLDYAKKGGSRQDEFDEIYNLIKDKIEYLHYTN